MNQNIVKEQKPSTSGASNRQSSHIQDYISEFKMDKGENQQNNLSHNHTSPSVLHNNNQSYHLQNPQISPKYHYERLPDISIRQNDTYNDDLDKMRTHQRSSGSLYRHNNEQMNLFNPYITKGSRSYSQKVLPNAVVLQQVKQERIIVQEQNQMLINRLRKLRQEELQLQKSAEQTAQRAEKVFQQKKFYIKKREEEQQRLQEQDDVGYTQPKKQLEMLRVQIAKEENLKKKKQGFYQVKQIIAEEQIRKAQEQKIAIENIKFKMEQMKKQKEMSKARKEQYLQEKKNKIERDIQKQRVREEALLSFAKFEAKDFEKREQEMLERIRQTQMVKDQARDQLKDSVTLDIFEYESRYLKEKRNNNNNNSHNISVTSLNGNPNKTHYSQKGIGASYNSRQISQQVLKINSNGQSYISNGES